jgi:hypothetical protein
MNELGNTVIELNIDLIFANEPYFHKNKISNIPLNWKVIQRDKNPRAAIIFTNDKLKPFSINSQISKNIAWCLIDFMFNRFLTNTNVKFVMKK